MAIFIQVALSSRVMLFFAPALFYLAAFGFSRRILSGTKTPSVWSAPLFAVINAGLLLLFSFLSSVPASMMTMTLVPLLVVLELLLVSRDGWWTYLNLYFSGALNLLCAHSFAGAIVNILMYDLWPAGSVEHRYAIFSLTMLLGALTYAGLSRSKITPIAVLSELMHSRSRGMLLFIYFVLTSAVLLISSQSLQSLMYDDTLPRHIVIAMHFDTALKDSLILICSFLIIMVQIWQEQQLHKQKALDQQLQMEREFRASSQSDSLLQYCVNTNRDIVLEGREIFPTLAEDGSGYAEAINQFVTACIHPEDRHLVSVGNDPGYYDRQLMSDSNYAMRFRVSPIRLLETADSWRMWGDDIPVEKEWIWVEFRINLIRDKGSDDILAYVALSSVDQDMSERETLRQAASRDGLTGLLNRAALDQAMKQSLSLEGASGTLYLIDMDYFKTVNDTLGHPAGDALLTDTANMLQSIFRENDLVARLGGDEFCVFAPGLRSEERISWLAAELSRQGRRTHDDKCGGQFQTSLSIGVAVFPDHAATAESLYQCADTALYRAKEAGRNTYRIYSPDKQLPDDQALENNKHIMRESVGIEYE